MSGFRIEGNVSGNVAEVDAAGNLKVNLPTGTSMGGVRMFSENDPGTITGTPLLKSPETSHDHRLRVGGDTLLFSDEFNATAQNTGIYKYLFTTMTTTMLGGFVLFNANSTATTTTGCYLQTWKHFPLTGTAPLYIEFTGMITATPLANQNFCAGVGIGATATVEPTDGVYFRLTSAGLTGVLKYNGTQNDTGVVMPISGITANTNAKYLIVVGYRVVQFWVDDVLLAELDTPNGQAQPFMCSSAPAFMMLYNSGTVSGSPQMQVKIGNLNVSLADLFTNKTWANQMCGMGLMAMQGQNGGTMGQTAQWSNTALPTAATATNITAALGTGLGGLFLMNAAATSATDVIICSYQNPAGGVNQTPGPIIIRGIRVDCNNLGAAVATTATAFAVSLAFGHTAVSLATTESASFANNTVKAPRRLPLGTFFFPAGAVIGQGASGGAINFDFEAPVIVNPGEFVAVTAKILVGTATASETFLWTIGFNAYLE